MTIETERLKQVIDRHYANAIDEAPSDRAAGRLEGYALRAIEAVEYVEWLANNFEYKEQTT